MTNWQDKYKDLEVGQSAWYWHKTKSIFGYQGWCPVEVCAWGSTQDNDVHLCSKSGTVSEDFPNGPKCLTPDEIDDELKFKQLENI